MESGERRHDGEPGGMTARLRAQQMAILLRNLPTSLAATAVNAILLALMLWPVSGGGAFGLWLGLNAALLAGRFVSLPRMRAALARNHPPFVEFHIWLTASALLWGLGLAILFPPDAMHQSVVLIIIVGMVAGANSSYVAYYPSIRLYTLCAMAPLALRLLVAEDFLHQGLGMLSVIYMAVVIQTGKRLHRSTEEAIRLRLENSDLAASLQQEKEQVEELNTELAESEALFRVLTESTASAIFIIQDNAYQYMNRAGQELTGYSLEELRAMFFWDLVHPDCLDEVKARGVSRQRNGVDLPPRYEFKIVTKSGEERWLDFQARHLTYQGRPAMLGTAFDVTERKNAELLLRLQAVTDELTGIANRRHFMEKFRQEFVRARRYDKPLCLLMIDVDYFKAINDAFGHDVGDQALRDLSSSIRSSLREVDVFGRLGGEEFGILLPETARRDALEVAERLRLKIHDLVLPEGGPSDPKGLTISVGVACLGPEHKTLEHLLKEADQVLYKAKCGGRDRVVTLDNGECGCPPTGGGVR